MQKNEYIQLDDLKINEKAFVLEVLDQEQRAMYMERGLVVGEELTMLRKSSMGHTLAIEVRGTVLAMRSIDASQVIVIKK
jgi:Fe2+ transport system protein FeoA